MANDLSNPIFHDDEAARKWLETRVWPNGPVCPHCKAENRATLMIVNGLGGLRGKASRKFEMMLVGVAGFEPTTYRSQSDRATRLRYTPNCAPIFRRNNGFSPFWAAVARQCP
jgi:hypothetical protein